MFEGFPYTNFHELNLDWIIKIAKDFLDQYTHIQEIITTGEESITDKTNAGLDQLQEKADTLSGLLDDWYTTHSEDIATELADALDSIQSTLTQAINTFASAAEEKAETTIASIPDDYSTLSANFTNLLNAIYGLVPADVLDYCARVSTTVDGLTISWSGNTAHITGQAEHATGKNMFSSASELPQWLIPGETYRVEMQGTWVLFQIYDYSGGNATLLLSTTSNTYWTCPDNITGVIIRWRVETTSHVIDEYITPALILIPSFNSMYRGIISSITYPNGDLNDITTCGVYTVDCANIQNAPLSSGVGFMEVIGNPPLLLQRFTFTTGLAYQRYINLNARTYSDWHGIVLVDPLYRASTITTGNLNSIITTQYLFISSPNTIDNLPEAGAGFLFVYHMTTTGIVFQDYYTYSGMHHYARQKTGSTWSSWVRIGGSGEGASIINNYTITTTPTITTDTNNWLQAIDNESTQESDATDMTGAIMSMLTSTGYCKLSEGTFYVSGNIDLPDGAMIEGCGKNTIVRLLSSVTTGYVFKPIHNNSIKNLRISGGINNPSFLEPTRRNGIYFVADRGAGNTIMVQHSTIENVWIENFNGSGIYCYRSGGGIREGLLCNNIMIDYCHYGINIAYYSEYHKFNNMVIANCDIACWNGGGNNTFNSCSFHGNTGFVIDNSNNTLTNEGHGSCVNCVFNHIGNNAGNAIEIINNPVTFQFVGCQNWYGKIIVRNSKGIMFSGCSFGGHPNITVSNNTIVLFAEGMFYQMPTINNEGSGNIVMRNCFYTATGEEL